MTGGMIFKQKLLLLLLRLSLGWMFFHAGITKLTNPDWSAAGYLAGAKTFPGLFHWFASPGILPFTDALNAWGLTLIGAALILGIAVRLSSLLGVVMMGMYYLVPLDFPHPNAHSYLVNEHVIYAIGLLILSVFHAGRIWGLGNFVAWLPVLRRWRRTLRR